MDLFDDLEVGVIDVKNTIDFRQLYFLHSLYPSAEITVDGKKKWIMGLLKN